MAVVTYHTLRLLLLLLSLLLLLLLLLLWFLLLLLLVLLQLLRQLLLCVGTCYQHPHCIHYQVLATSHLQGYCHVAGTILLGRNAPLWWQLQIKIAGQSLTGCAAGLLYCADTLGGPHRQPVYGQFDCGDLFQPRLCSCHPC
jgi:hypothetical protein